MSSNPSNKDPKPEILIDIGCQKTGTTSRQINLYSKLSQDTLLYTGKFYERKSESNTRLQNFVSSAWKDPSQFEAQKWSTLFYLLLTNLIQNCGQEQHLFSEEKLLLNIWQMGLLKVECYNSSIIIVSVEPLKSAFLYN